MALIKKLTQDLKMEMQANDMEEKTAQEDYEELMADSAEKRAGDSKTITEKEAQKVRGVWLGSKIECRCREIRTKGRSGDSDVHMALQAYSAQDMN